MSGLHVVAISGGKDSTAMALALKEREPRDYVYLITPTGDELPEMLAHWERLERELGQPLLRLGALTLDGLIERFGALPNWRQRWCTRVLKIEPCLAWIRQQADAVTLYVGLRADEEERRGIYSNDVVTDFPLRRWGWGIGEVRGFLRSAGVRIPSRTDCARCYGQRIDEWFSLWRDHRDIFNDAAAQERATGHTFRSPGRDTWPASLDDLSAAFDAGRIPRKSRVSLTLIDDDGDSQACRVCRV